MGGRVKWPKVDVEISGSSVANKIWQGIEIREFLKSTYHIYTGPDNYILKKTDWFSMVYKGKDNPLHGCKVSLKNAHERRECYIDNAHIDGL